MSDANDLIMGGGVEAAKFENINDFVQGTIIKIGDKTQCRKFKKKGELGDLDYWDAACTQPKWQVRIDLQTDVRDPLIANDDGIRGVYVPAGKQIRTAVQSAVKAVGEKEIKVGAHLGVQLVELEENDTNNPTKIYKAVYGAPPAQGNGMIMEGNTQAVQMTQQPAMQAQMPVPAQMPTMQSMTSGAPVQVQQAAPSAEQLAQFAAWQAAQNAVSPPATTMQHNLGTPGMTANPNDNPAVAQLLANVAQQGQ